MKSNNKTYEGIRLQLLSHNFIFKKLYEELDFLIFKIEQMKKDGKQIDKSELKRMELLANFVYLLKTTGGQKVYQHMSNMFLSLGGGIPLTEQGVYVRYLPNMTKNDWIRQYEKAKLFATNTAVYKHLEEKQLPHIKKRKQVGYKDAQRNIDLYLSIEKEIPKYWEQKNSGKKLDPVEALESGVSIVDRILEDMLVETNIEDDHELNKLKQQYKNTYYAVADRYELPTLRELPSYLNLLNEIAS